MIPNPLRSIALASLVLLAPSANAQTVAHWRFEGAGFMDDSAGGNTLTDNASVAQVATPFSNPVPRTGEANANAASFSGTNYLTAADNTAFTGNQFTLEAFFSPASIGTATRIIAGHFGSDAPFANQRSYALVMTSTGELRAYVSPDGSTPAQFAGATLTAGKNYYAAMAVDVAGSGSISIYLQDLSTTTLQVFNYTEAQRAQGPTSITSVFNAAAPFAIGSTGQGSAQWVGTIDEVRLSNVKLAQPDLLISPPQPPPPPPGETPTWPEFRNARFGPDVTSEANPYADPDGDGTRNLFEHAFGSAPFLRETTRPPVADFSSAPASLTFSYPKKATDVDYFVEWSPDLSPGSWSQLGFGAETQDPVTEWFSRTLELDPPLARCFMRMGVGLQDPANLAAYPKAGGFRGIWFALGQVTEYGDKYSGGLGTYTANHVPMAHYAPEVNRTYFTYGGTPSGTQRLLHIMVSYYDHNTGLVARPVRVMDKSPVNDPHDNASMSIDEEGYIWIFVSGRSTTRLGRIYRSKVPYGINDWVNLGDSEFTYPQPWWFEGRGFLHTYTRYTNGRELYMRTSRNGTSWNAEKKLAGIGGHYQTSCQVGNRLITAFNRHPGGNVDARTDLYYMETPDMGATWTTAGGTVLTTPLTTAANPARIRNYSSNANTADNALVYIHDVTADAEDKPVILYLTAKDYRPGPNGDPRAWMVARWTGTEWLFHTITTSTHNYDTGAIHIEPDGTWKVIGPTAAGPQYWGAGGEMEVWTSTDQGVTWAKQRAVTANSTRNHSYARRPRDAHPNFYAYWADGNADALSESHLWFTNQAGDKLWHLPYDITGDFAAPILVEP